MAIAAGVIVVAAAVGVGLSLIESPWESRARRMDVQRACDLDQLARDVDVYRSRRGTLPASLEELAAEPALGLSRTDPEQGVPYGYRVVDDAQFEICAVFAMESGVAPSGVERQFWSHGAGRQCFVVKARDK
jgi:hypothetical protein